MKKRTVIGLICMVLAVAVTFIVAPMVNKLSSDTERAVRLCTNVNRGVQITGDMLEIVEIKAGSLPAGAITDERLIVGKYASTLLYAGDYLSAEKLTGEANTASDVLSCLDGSKVAVSVTISSFAAGLSGKLENGDIISLIVIDRETGEASIPEALTYMKVITTTTSGGIDQDAIVKNEDGSYEIPTTVTLLANREQAMLLTRFEKETTITAALVYRGSSETAKLFLDKQDEYFLSPEEEPADEPGEPTETSELDASLEPTNTERPTAENTADDSSEGGE
ncbi:MAG: RcpC/CpaB family pilus assembly protein [Eubacteriales bacterium]|nr:RcpC/CpaB family pilus assembly protein [Eubacteriales bacterium]